MSKKSSKRMFSDLGEKLTEPHPTGGYNQVLDNGFGGHSYVLNGWPHREDGPAVTWPDGTELWYREGKLHRDDGPAKIKPNGHRIWYQNGQIVKEEGKVEWSPMLVDPGVESDTTTAPPPPVKKRTTKRRPAKRV